MSVDHQPAIETGRIDRDSTWYDLYQKGIELGAWDVEKLFETVGVEEDIEVWNSLDPDQKEEWARLIAVFLDLEQAVAEDGRRVIEIASSPYLDNNFEKEMYAAVFTMTEVKHTQFFDMYINTVMSDVFPDSSLDIRRGGHPLPRTAACGMSDLGDRQGALMAIAADGGDPVDIARAATAYHMSVEGIAARAGYSMKNEMMAEAPLKLLNKGFQFVSTDEGRHVTHGLELLTELLEKERAGEPDYQGVDKAIWEQALVDIRDILDTGFFISAARGDPIEGGYVNERTTEIWRTQFDEVLDLEHYDEGALMEIFEESIEQVQETDYDARIERHREIYQRKVTGSAGEGR